MTLTIKQRKAAYDIGLLALCLAFVALIIGRNAFSPTVHTGLLIISVIVIGVVNTMREAFKEAQLDEVQLAAASFGARWAITIPCTLMLLMIFFPPLQNATLDFAGALAAASDSPIPSLLRVFIMGMVLAVILQLAGKSLIAAVWSWRKR